MLSEEISPLEQARKRVRRAKRDVRSELSVTGGDWQRGGLAQRPELLAVDAVRDTLPRVDARVVSQAQFAERFEKTRIPCLIINAMEAWPAAAQGGDRQWTWPGLRRRLGGHRFKVGSDDDGFAVRLSLEHFLSYLDDPVAGASCDDSPLYVFDGTFGEKEGSKALLEDFSVPAYFAEDLLALAGNKKRPPFRWVVFGPARSGSSLHIDPLATSAWNALLVGTKRWALLPPGVPREACKPRGAGFDGEAVTWFDRVLPATQSAAWSHARPIEGVQRAGEIMFVPSGWWHAVLNVQDTACITQNFASSANLADVWRHTRKARPRLAAIWRDALQAARPDLMAVLAHADADGRPVSESSPSSTSSSSSAFSDEEMPVDGGDPAELGSKRMPSTCAGHELAEQGAPWRRRCAT